MERPAERSSPRIIGHSTPALEGAVKVAAEARYLEDLQAPGMLYGKICRSPLPHARILDIDTTRAERLSGVVAVITARDMPDIKFSFVPELADKTALCGPGRTVRYAGDEVAAVAALDEATAEEAARLIEVSYEPLEPVLDLEAALSPDSPTVHDDGNLAYEVHKAEGDVDAAFAGCDLVLEEEFETARQSHAVMEARGCIAQYGAAGELTVWHQTQAPHTLRAEIARTLGIPERRVRVIQPETGGGFGSRLVMNVMVPIGAVLSRKSGGRPVRIVNTRDEEFRCAGARYAYRFRLKLGCTRDGVIRAKSLEVLGDNGAYHDKGVSTINFITMTFFSSYHRHHPATSVDASLIYTNKPPGAAFRGFGHAEKTFAFESLLDTMAERLGIDPVEIRLTNLHRPCERACLERAAEVMRPTKGTAESTAGTTRTGIGMAVLSETGAGLRYYRQNSTEAIVRVDRDGTVGIIATIADTGTGTRTVMAQIAAEELGVSVDRVRIFHNDTDVIPFDLGSWASRTTFVCGNAVAAAAADARRRLAEVAAGMLQAVPDTLRFDNDRVAATVEPGGEVSFDEVVREAYDRRGLLIIGKGAFVDEEATRFVTNDYEAAAPVIAACCHVAEVRVDTETGTVELLRYLAVHDVGKAINPLGIQGQIEGGLTQGLGFALYEDLVVDGGQVLNPNFVDYRLPTFRTMPRRLESEFLEGDPSDGPYGAKGIGEMPFGPAAPAIANAIYNAVGVRLKALPMTPERVWRGLKERA
ncbi:MAG: xanthine dehydrogenase family protein molybdopterin-binding subunit [Deltaproteobacteria bacterium]|nr:xanthine dehydrogenase family protein molybdopterin-binding subunit [Deltaproteobacteria bacterium]